ncbi:MAG TPA: MBOAT family protein, partial [Bacteroidales bacterium]|nr:MBOAT family protein [Bacteroidales bacterium]
RLFFRSGSNLDPAEANATAWNTAKTMVNMIGGKWDFSKIPQIIDNYLFIFILFAVGMLIHWLPEKWKRWYRLNFALLPIWVQGIIVVIVVFTVYQFITADLQPFIYFQF